MKRAGDREAELERVMVHVKFHDDAGDFDEWLEEKKVAVNSIRPRTTSVGISPMENLRQIRTKIKKLGDIDAELAANIKVR